MPLLSGMATIHNFHDVERLAYFLYVSRGRQEGQAISQWLEAENQLSEYQVYCAADAQSGVFSAQVLPADAPQSRA